MNLQTSAITHLVIFIIWAMYSLMEGRRDGYYYHSAVKTGDSDKFNLHFIYQLQRALVLFLCMALSGNIFIAVAMGFSMICTFSYLHNGAYYSTRNNLNKVIYPLRWKDDSTTSNSTIEIQYGERIIIFIAGCFVFAITMIFALSTNTLSI